MYNEQITEIGVTESTEELYQSLVKRVRSCHHKELSDLEAHRATRNLIEFVKLLLKYRAK